MNIAFQKVKTFLKLDAKWQFESKYAEGGLINFLPKWKQIRCSAAPVISISDPMML